ncbi:MAG: fructose-1,6-bisphosphatase [Porphyromonadaceae bacterium]|nr:MAG: fructose-1,6-bisphosphatase [Porphyromonadaceae bacterium]
MDQNYSKLNYLKLLSRNFPNAATASTEIINLEAILNLPKGTEHFLADLHGEYEAFQHVLRNASGTIKRKVKEIFNETLSNREQKEICTLIYYPGKKTSFGEIGIYRPFCAGRLVFYHH